jgi:hypothetical protein
VADFSLRQALFSQALAPANKVVAFIGAPVGLLILKAPEALGAEAPLFASGEECSLLAGTHVGPVLDFLHKSGPELLWAD